ncbi:MAG: hypothetical protein ACKVTZ_21330, partial [Bacteroidia bacterium]
TVAGFLRHNNELEAFYHKGTMNEQTFCAYVEAFIAMPERDLTKQNLTANTRLFLNNHLTLIALVVGILADWFDLNFLKLF